MRLKLSLIWSTVVATVLSLLTIWLSGTHVPTSSEKELVKNFTYVKKLLWDTNDTIPDNFLFINIAYDKVLVDVNDEYGFHIGQIDITDRDKLIRFLEIASAAGTYKSIILDIDFTDANNKNTDTSLTNVISDTPRVFLPSPDDTAGIAVMAAPERYGHSDYAVSFSEGDFVKYIFFDGDNPSLAWRAYAEGHNSSHHEFLGFDFEGHKLMRQASIIDFPIYFTEAVDDEGYRNYHNLGADILSDTTGVADLINNKYVFVGDFTDKDMHDSFIGPISGPLIHANALACLLTGHHRVSFWFIFFTFLLYFVLSFMMFRDSAIFKIPKSISSKIENHRTFAVIIKIGQSILPYIGLGTILSAMCIVCYLILGEVYDILIIGVIFILIRKVYTLATKNNS